MNTQNIKRRLMPYFWALVNVVAAGFFVCTLVGFLGTRWWIFDLISHFRVQYIVGLVVRFPVYGLGKRQRFAIATAIFLTVNLVLVLPFYIDPGIGQAEGDVYRILFANVNKSNRRHRAVRELIAEADADFVLLLEVNQKWLDDLNLEELNYPYSIVFPQDNYFGLALYSRLPLYDTEILELGKPSILARFELPKGQLTLLGVHTIAPRNAKFAQHRDMQMQAMADFISAQDGALLLVGDINMTSWSPSFWIFTRQSGLRDSSLGFGIQPTWPTDNWALQVPIDHALVSPQIIVHHREVGPHIGSDHYPLIMEFSFSDKDGNN